MSRVNGWLVVSLVLNVFLLGAMGGGVYTWLDRHPAAQPRGLRFAATELTAARQDEFKTALQRMRRDNALEGIGRAARLGRLDVIDALSAEPFDARALDAALARTRNADVALRTRTEAVIATFAATLTPGERLKLVDALERRGPLAVGMTAKRPGGPRREE